jgi:hypothetical protein
MQIHQLGKQAPRLDRRTLRLSNYLKKLPTPPTEVSWVTQVPGPWPMFLNDTLGTCVIAAMGHMVQQWTFYASGASQVVQNTDILKAYRDLSGYVPGDPSTDNGVVMLDALKYWRTVGLAGHRIAAYAAVNLTDVTELLQAIQLFGNCFAGLSLPVTAQGEGAWTVSPGGIFTLNGAPGSWGGHCVPYMAASPVSRTCIAWGDRLKLSPNFSLDYVDELYAVVSQEWIDRQGVSPSGLDLKTLLADVAAIR